MKPRTLFFALLLAAGCASALEVTPLELTTGAKAAQANVAANPAGGFIVTWQEQQGAKSSLWFAALNAEGRETRRGRVATGSDWFVNTADFPSLVVLQNGDWVTHSLRKSAQSRYAYDVLLWRSVDQGRSWRKAVSPHTDGSATQHGFVSLLADTADWVRVVWLDGRLAAGLTGAGENEEEAPMTLRTALVNRLGERRDETSLDDRTCSCCQTDAVRWVGRTLVAYRDRSAEEVRDIAVVALGQDNRWSPPRVLNDDGWKIEGCPVNGPALAVNGEKLLALWPTAATGAMQVRYTVRQWDQPAVTTVLDAEGSARRVDAAALGDGFVISWLGGNGAASALHLAVIDQDGALREQRAVTTPALKVTGFPRMASQGETVLLAWTANLGGDRSTIRLLRISGR
jgi:hypothetical protein